MSLLNTIFFNFADSEFELISKVIYTNLYTNIYQLITMMEI